MRHFIRAAAFAAALLVAGQAWAQKSFVRDDLASEGVRLEERLRVDAASTAAGRPAAQLRREAEAAMGRSDHRRALALASAAVAADPRDAANWLTYAKAARAVDPRNWTERYELQERATAAAYLAYQRAGSRADEAAALVQLAEAFEARSMWRPAINAYKASLDLVDTPRTRQAYETAREKHGFRILDYKVESDLAAPRVCFQFSEALARGRVDFAPFVAVTGTSGTAVTTEGQQLCVEGLRHGERYGFVLRQGLPSGIGETLLKNADYEVYVRDRSPQARFTGRNYVLPRTGQEGIPVVTVNMDKAAVEVFRIGDRNLLPTLRSDNFLAPLSRTAAGQIAREKGVKIWFGTLDVRNETNRDVVTAFPVTEAAGALQPGVYIMTARPPTGEPANDAADDTDFETVATQWFVVSDLGLTVLKGEDGVHVLARGLGDAKPLKGVEVRLVARNNEILGSRTTDENGHARFDPGLARGNGGMSPGLVTATLAGDYGFLDLQLAAFDLSDRGVKGRAATGALEAFVFPERGVYRSGETVYLTALLRDLRGAGVGGLPLTLVVRRPDGVEHRRAVVEDRGLGGRAFSLPLMGGAMRGTWRVTAFVDPKGPAVGEATFLVEDYVPERLELTLTPKAPVLRAGQPAVVDVEARYLFGAPGAALEVTGEVVVEASAGGLPGLAGYQVGLDDEPFEASRSEIEDKGTTDARGQVTMQIPVPDAAAPRPTEARIALRVAEPGGRAVERSVTLPILPSGPVIGVRKTFADTIPEGGTATFDVVAAQPDGRRIARAATWSLYRVERRYQWFNNDGRWGYEPVKSSARVAEGRVEIGVDAPARVGANVTWGTYRLEVRGEGMDGAATSVGFTVGWSGDQTADVPDLLDMTLDKAAYVSGDALQARLSPRFAGTATLAVVSDKVHEVRVVDVPAAGGTVSIPVKAEWGSGAYLVALAHRPLDQAARRQPGRSLGVAWFSVDRAARTLAVTLTPPKEMRPRGTLAIPVRLAGLNPGEEARVTVAAVDVGILNLTRYQAPDPAAFFLGQRQLGTEVRDLYGYLIDGMQGTRGAIRAGGDGVPALDAAAPAQEPLARYSGVVRVGPDGTAEVAFEIPAFNGTVRVMGVAWTGDRVGSASADVIVRDPVVVAGTLPRFLSVGDQSRIHLQLDNVDGAAGDYTLDLDIRGPVLAPAADLRRTVRLERGAKGSVTIPLTAAGPGTAVLAARLTGPGLDVSQTFALRVQPGTSALVRRTVRTLEPGASVTVSNDLLADILPGTGAVSVAVSTFSGIDVPGLLQSLDRYPYGCTEQTVSRALPLLYVNRLAQTEALAIDGALDGRIRGAIERVLSRQASTGTFGLWGIGGNDVWLDAYVTDFLTRARELGHPVPQGAFASALDRLRNHVANTTEIGDANASGLAYAAYVLARNGRPVMGDLRYLADTKLAEFKTPLARGQIGAALALLGDRGRSATVLAAAVDQLRTSKDGGRARDDYGTRLRDGAGLLALAGEADLPRDAVRTVIQAIAEERPTARTTSTQENAWLVLAAQAVQRESTTLALSVNGAPHQGALYRTWRGEALDRAPATIANTGTLASQVVISTSGNPVGPEPAFANGYAVERSYYRLDGTAADPAQVRQNDRLVTVLKVTEPATMSARVLLVDRLPAGFEIDNPKLVDSGTVEALGWLKTDVQPEHTEYRDDRFVAAYERSPGQPAFFTVAYIVRAVAPGRYTHPPAHVEDMYRPERFGRTAFGTVEVQARP